MCGGGGGKQKPSANDIALAQSGGYYDQVFTQDFLPLEVQEIEQWRNPAVREANRSLIAGRQAADVGTAEQAAFASNRGVASARGTGLGSGQSIAGIQDTGTLAAQGLADANISASQAARSIQDGEGMGIVRTGLGLARGATNSLGTLARADGYEASAKLQAKTAERGALFDAVSSVASAGYARHEGDKRARERKAEFEAMLASRESPVGAQPSVSQIFGLGRPR